MSEFIAYYRVSTEGQQESGLGIEAQMEKVRSLVAARGGQVVSEFTETESGRKANRPVLAQALQAARKAKAVLVVAKLDRLARDAELINRLSKEVANNGFPGLLFADLPDIDATNAAGRMILGVMAQVAQFEAERIGERTREALAAAKARGVKLGGRREAAVLASQARRGEAVSRAEALRGVLTPMVAAGQSQRQIAAALNAAGHRTERGNQWTHKTVGRVIERLRAPRDNGRFSDPSSFGGEPAIRWPEGVPEPKSGDPLYEETHAAVYGYEFNGKRFEIGPDGRPQEVAG